jgi:hypothetical protein
MLRYSFIVGVVKLELALTCTIILSVPVVIVQDTASVPAELAIASSPLLDWIAVVYVPALLTAEYVTWSECA